MKHFCLIAISASLLAGCAATEPSKSAPAVADIEMVDAVTRKPINTPAPAPAPAPKPAATLPQPGPMPSQTAIRTEDRVIRSGQIDPDLDPATARSYNATWTDGGFRHRSVMFPHVIDGCKVMIQSRRTLDYVGGTEGEFFEREGPDCDCDLVIDGFEDVFAQLNDEYKTPRMYDVCAGPGVDGETRKLEIMRETLKEQRNFDKMKNVDGF